MITGWRYTRASSARRGTIAPGARREHEHAEQVAGEVDDERRDQQHLHRPAVVERVGGDQRRRSADP